MGDALSPRPYPIWNPFTSLDAHPCPDLYLPAGRCSADCLWYLGYFTPALGRRAGSSFLYRLVVLLCFLRCALDARGWDRLQVKSQPSWLVTWLAITYSPCHSSAILLQKLHSTKQAVFTFTDRIFTWTSRFS